MTKLFRCGSDIYFEPTKPKLGLVHDVHLKTFSETCNIIQYLKPLTQKVPYFQIQVQSMGARSEVIIGIAGQDIGCDATLGHWNHSVGYSNKTGHCYSSHTLLDKSNSIKFGIGDVFGVLVTYFGVSASTVLFLKNGTPVATRYLYQVDHNKLFPSLSLTNGPIDVGIMWQDATLATPVFSETNMLQWIRKPSIIYDVEQDIFFSKIKLPVGTQHSIQSPVPLSTAIQHYEVVVKEVSETGAGPVIGICSCSPLMPPPTNPLLNDYFYWQADGKRLKNHVSQKMGWGIHYNPVERDRPGFDDKAEQLVLCYVSVDLQIVFARMMLQPNGGWYPTVFLNSGASKVKIDVESNRLPAVYGKLDELYKEAQYEAQKALQQHKETTETGASQCRISSDLHVQYNVSTTVHLSKGVKGVHVIQLKKPLTEQSPYFCIEIEKCGDSSIINVGVADANFPLNKFPGRLQGTVGYQSRDGKMYYNDKDTGNTEGIRYSRGDVVGVEISSFHPESSVVLFHRNLSRVGTRFLTQGNHQQFFPTVAMCGNGSEVIVNITWQDNVAGPPIYSIHDIRHWCLPGQAITKGECSTIYFDHIRHIKMEAIQAPTCLSQEFNHFEIELIDRFDDVIPPPAISMCSACPQDPSPQSNFKQDFIRFWARGEAMKAVKQGDLIGMGILYPDKDTSNDQLVISYVTINRDVALTRVIYQPPGGFYPVVLVPPGVNRVKFNFGATCIKSHPFTPKAIELLLNEAKKLLAEEEEKISRGEDIKDAYTEEELREKLLRGVPKVADNIDKFKDKLPKDMLLQKERGINDTVNLLKGKAKKDENNKIIKTRDVITSDDCSNEDRTFQSDDCLQTKSNNVVVTHNTVSQGTQTVMKTKACILL